MRLRIKKALNLSRKSLQVAEPLVVLPPLWIQLAGLEWFYVVVMTISAYFWRLRMIDSRKA